MDQRLLGIKDDWEGRDKYQASTLMSLMPYAGPMYSFMSAVAGRDLISGEGIGTGWRAAAIVLGPFGGPSRRFLGTSNREAQTLVGAWGKGTFNSLKESLVYHYDKWGARVGAKDMLTYLRKAWEFNRNLRGAKSTLVQDGIRYEKNGYFIIRDMDGNIVAYGRVTR